MKRRKDYSGEIMLLCGLLALGVGVYAFGGRAAGKVAVPKESMDIDFDSSHSVSVSGTTDDDARHFYLCSDGTGGTIEVEEVKEPQSDWEKLKEEDSGEIHLSFIKIDENTYTYRDKSGALIATLEIKRELSEAVPCGEKLYSINWSLKKGEYSRGTVSLSLGTIYKFHVYMTATVLEKTYIGLYSSELDQYTWMELPLVSQDGRDYKFSLSSPAEYQFALKNSENASDNQYFGRYYVITGG